MTKNLSIRDCIHILKYYNKEIPNNLYKIKRKTNVILNKYICQFYNKNNMIFFPFCFSKHKYLFTNTKRFVIKSVRSTRMISPNSYLSCI
jgi:hypothetical protein